MTKKLQKTDKGMGIVIDEALLNKLDIDESTEFEVRTDGRSIILIPTGDGERSLKDEANELMDRFNQTFEELSE
jgi:antitoxin component of MazEF toxin-antitoxin module